jgi:crotonobetainyl-CoA:carnitine CoA-transferase CaiB-like acyl-CoA transferase
MTLGDLGADVVKVESPAGDDTRRWGPPYDAAKRATYFHAVNRNKRSVVLDLRDRNDADLAHRLCARADVVLSNFRPGTLEKFGIGYTHVEVENPRVVYCEISGFGEGKGSDLPGYDPLVQAVGGLMSVTGPPGAPSKTGVALVDVIAGLHAAIAVLAALHERERSLRGQRITINLLHTTLAALANQASAWLCAAAVPGLLGNAHPSIEPFGTFRARDGELMICCGNDGQFRALAATLGLPELASDSRFATNSARVDNRDALRALLEEALEAATTEKWWLRLRDAGVPAGPVHDIPRAFAYAGALGLDVVDEQDGVRTVKYPALLSRTPAVTRRRPPDRDEHGDEIRGWLHA